MQNTIYRVTTEGDVEGRTVKTLGYCTGNQRDIIDYYDDKKCYELKLTPITVEAITPQLVSERKSDLERMRNLTAELERLKKRL